MKRFNTRLLLIATVTCLLACAATTYAAYTMVDLGTVYDGITDTSGRCTGINNAGQVVGYTTGPSGTHAFIWDAVNGMKYMGTLGGNSEARGINNAGIATGWSNGKIFFYNSATHVMTDSTATQGIWDVFCIGLSAPGGVNMIGGWSNGSDPLVPWGQACMWSPSTLVNIGNFGGGIGQTQGCNDYGEMVGWAHNASSRTCAFRWTSAGGKVEIPAMADKLGKTGVGVNWWDRGEEVNNSGQVAGWGWYTNSLEKAWFWDPAVVPSLTEIPFLPSGNRAMSRGINNSAQVVGYSTCGLGNECHVFLWDAVNGIQDLGAPVPHIDNAYQVKINDAGLIAGRQLVSGVEHPTLWQPPAPSGTTFTGTVTLVDWNGASLPTVTVTVDGGTPVVKTLTGSGSSGTFTLSLTPASHVIKVKAVKSLSQTVTGSGTTPAFFLQCGDTNDDNKIDDLDFLSVIGNFGSTDPVLKLIGDGNGDDKTDDLDFLNVIGKFATSGT